MKRPLAYITAAWSGSEIENAETAARYCRQVYDAGYSPSAPSCSPPVSSTMPSPRSIRTASTSPATISAAPASWWSAGGASTRR